MKVIVCGAGQVGFNIARYLAQEDNDVFVIDQDPDLTRKVSDTLDAKAITGHASDPSVLALAGAGDADMIIAVTHADEINMVACQVAHSLFDVTTKIARIRRQGYLQPLWSNLFSRDHMPIDVIISPEMEVARAIIRRLQVPGAFDMISLADGNVKLLGVRCGEECPLLHTPLRQLTQLFPNLNIIVIGVVRDGNAFIPSSDDQLTEGDDVYFVVDGDQVARAMTAFGHEEPEARRLVIFGGGNIGLFLAQEIEREYPAVNVKIVEADKARAEYVAGALARSVVLQGDALDAEILDEANVAATETAVAVTNDDETNILAALLAKRRGSQRAITLVNSNTYNALTNSLDLDVVVSPRSITVSTILHYVRRGRIHAVYTLGDGFGELIEAEALETSPLVGGPLRDVDLPDGVIVGSVVRDGKVIPPRGSTVVEAGDRVVLFAAAEAVRHVEKMFSVRLEFF